jgi:protease II
LTCAPFSQVIAHLKAETAYTEAALADTEALQEALYKELRGRIQACPESVALARPPEQGTGSSNHAYNPIRSDAPCHKLSTLDPVSDSRSIAVQEADQSAPQRHGPYFYYSRTVEGGQYRINCRRPVPPTMGSPSGVPADYSLHRVL